MWNYLQLAVPTEPNNDGNATPQLPVTRIQDIFVGYVSDQVDDNEGDQADNEEGSGPKDCSPTNGAAIGCTSLVAEAVVNVGAMWETVVSAGPTWETVVDTGPTCGANSLDIAERKCHSTMVGNLVPGGKHCKLEIPACTRCQGEKNRLFFVRIEALKEIEKLLNAKCSPFEGGHCGLQAPRVRAIHGYLHMVMRNGHRQVDASEKAAETQGFAPRWGGRQVCAWVNSWVD